MVANPARNVLVTGGAGYIGSHTCLRLAAAGWRPVVYDNLVYGHRWAVQWGPLEVGDLADRRRLDAVLDLYQPAAAIHFAAYTYVGESVENPAKYYHNNVAGTLSLLDALQARGVDKLVFSSTSAVYGEPRTVPIPEDHALSPINPYGRTKLMIEQMLADFDRAYGLRYAALRYFNAAGADPEGRIGEDHDPETHLIPLVLQTALGRRPRLAVYGDDYDTPDGTCIRDYIHVLDLADAHVRALEHLMAGGRSLTANLGVGRGYSVKEVLAAAERITRRPIPFDIVARRPGDPPALVSQSRRALEILEWRPSFSDLDTVVATAWEWHRAQSSQP